LVKLKFIVLKIELYQHYYLIDIKTMGTIYPTGKWIGTYFSEELKDVLNYGYKFKPIRGWSYYNSNLFTEFINHFYQIKKIVKLTFQKDE
jgi:hypothetical protein